MEYTYTPFYAYPDNVKRAIAKLVRRYGEHWHRQLDFDDMILVPQEWVADKRKRFADLIWAVPLKMGARQLVGATHFILILKIQSTVVPDAVPRMRRYRELLHLELDRRRAFGAPDNPPLLAPTLSYHGEEPWTLAPEDASHLLVGQPRLVEWDGEGSEPKVLARGKQPTGPLWNQAQDVRAAAGTDRPAKVGKAP
ncbi:MAG: hypothetical protein OXE83_00170 [Gammaproteobacteria bacterium]|nr:hypothetical protein [Gammaproteobacteria bacterium]